MSLSSSLGLSNVEADPNSIPDGRYEGKVLRSQYVHVPKSNTVSHVITYQVTSGDHKGASRDEWFRLGTGPQFAEDGKTIVGLDEFTMSDQQKSWYKKRFLDLGVPEDKVDSVEPGDLVGIPVAFGVKRNGEYVNVNFAEKMTGEASAEASPNGGLI